MKNLAIFASLLLFTSNLFAQDANFIDTYDSYAQMDAAGNASEKFAAYTKSLCKSLKLGQGIRKVGLEFNYIENGPVLHNESVTPVSIIGIVVNFKVGNDVFVHNVNCYYEKIVSNFNAETNTFNIITIDPKTMLAFFNKDDEQQYGSGAKDIYSRLKSFKSKNMTTFLLKNLPAHKKLTLTFDKNKFASYLDEYTSIFIYNDMMKIRNPTGGLIYSFVDVTRVDDTTTGVYERLTNTFFEINN